MQPHTCGTASPRGGAAPWLRAVHRNVDGAGQVFHAGGETRPAALGGGAVTPDTNHVRFLGSQVYVIEPQLP